MIIYIFIIKMLFFYLYFYHLYLIYYLYFLIYILFWPDGEFIDQIFVKKKEKNDILTAAITVGYLWCH